MIPVVRYPIRYVCVGLATLICVTACSQALQLTLFNNTRDSITIHLIPRHGFRKERNIAIGSHLSARFDYPGRSLHMSAAGCELTYIVPQTLQGYPFPRQSYNVPVQAQVEPDLAIYLVPFDTKSISDVRRFEALQIRGFPLRPSLRSCSRSGSNT
jgi:hypothetical protein